MRLCMCKDIDIDEVWGSLRESRVSELMNTPPLP